MSNNIKIKEYKNGVEIKNTDISLEKTFTCGQCFRWHEKDGKWFGIVNGSCECLTQLDNGIYIENTDICKVNDFWLNYLDINDEDDSFQGDPNDVFLNQAIMYGKGIHILNQDPFETIVSFIISSNNNIKRIEKIIEKLCSLYGKEIRYADTVFYSFPTFEELSGVKLEDLALIKAGFRDRYIFDFIQVMKSEPDFISHVSSAETGLAKKELMRVKGIGDKVSDCILLFAFGRREVFPKDVWIKKVIDKIYGSDFDEKKFGNHAGIAQQYIYYYARLGEGDILS